MVQLAELIAKELMERGFTENEIVKYLWSIFNTADIMQAIQTLFT